MATTPPRRAASTPPPSTEGEVTIYHLRAWLRGKGMQMNQQVTFLPDGGDDVRDLPPYLNPQAEHLLDWFHLTARITVMRQHAKGLRASDGLAAAPVDTTPIRPG